MEYCIILIYSTDRRDNMRLKISKSKNTTLFYIIKDYTKNGKRSTKIVKRIGNLEDVKKLAGNQDYKDWLKEYVKKYNEEHCKKEIITIKKNNKEIIKKLSNQIQIITLMLDIYF